VINVAAEECFRGIKIFSTDPIQLESLTAFHKIQETQRGVASSSHFGQGATFIDDTIGKNEESARLKQAVHAFLRAAVIGIAPIG